MSDQDLMHEMDRISNSVTAFAAMWGVRVDDITEIIHRLREGKAQQGDPSLDEAQEAYFSREQEFTQEIRTEYYPELSSLRSEALRRSHGPPFAESKEERTLWEDIRTSMESPPRFVIPFEVQEYAKCFSKLGQSILVPKPPSDTSPAK